MPITKSASFYRALVVVVDERATAEVKHGPLQTGEERWMRLISEEYQEVMDELTTLGHFHVYDSNSAEVLRKAKSELAQLAQLCIGVIELLQQEEEGYNGKGKG